MCEPTQMKTNDKAWLWICYDCSEETPAIEKLCAKFPTKEGKLNALPRIIIIIRFV